MMASLITKREKYPDASFIVDAENNSEPLELKIKLTGEGNVKFTNGTVRLTSADNTYEGKTFVATNSKLEIGKNSSLGHTTGLKNQGTVDAS